MFQILEAWLSDTENKMIAIFLFRINTKEFLGK